MKMEPIVSSETSAIRTQTPGNYPKRNNLHLEHGESLRTKLRECFTRRSPLYPHGGLAFYLKIETHQITRYATDEVTISMTKETIDVNQTDPIKTVPSHFQADTSTANITYRYQIIRFAGADQQSVNSLPSSHT